MNQSARIIEDLRRGEGVTPLTALERYGCLSLSQRISELRKRGFVFTEEWVGLPNGKRVKKFTLALEPTEDAA